LLFRLYISWCLTSAILINADEYLISFRYVVKDDILYNENLQVSRSMKKCYGNPTNILILKNYNNNLKDTISKNSQKFINFIHKVGMEVQHKDKTIDAVYTGTTILTFRTTCFKVDFNENFAKIATLK